MDENEDRSTLQRSSDTRVEEIESIDDVAYRILEQATVMADQILDDVDMEYDVASEIVPLSGDHFVRREQRLRSHLCRQRET